MWLASSGPPGQVRVVAVDEPHDAGGPDLVAARLEHDLGEGLGGLAGDDHAVLGEVERGEVEGAGPHDLVLAAVLAGERPAHVGAERRERDDVPGRADAAARGHPPPPPPTLPPYL